ncbi:long-chain fatty acid--CoA ligase [Vulcanibacillus modesticaldus]|uniref:Long-chain fatty acid--CoA ligase n=1 Tax=Vulcanibacillus modesticaldus TaxID=337097 RepID=A0A1D2YSC2_9BACI|nr:long-chain fatty acid--CoA ligase [Vulcanibacillus modesticaldus]OEF96917.1 long-chain fatty acid--CoA ligase [Vulcanibacillus modesticaldus]
MSEGVEKKIWLSSYPKEVPHSIDYPIVSLAQLLIDTATEFPENDAIFFMGKRIKYKSLLEQTYQFAHALKSMGVKKGDRVAIMLPNSPQAVISYYGTLMIGATVVQTNPLYTERELEHQMVDSGAETIITLDLLYPKVAKVKPLSSLKNIIVTSIKDYLPFPKNILYPLSLIKDKQYIKIPKTEGVFKYSSLLKIQPKTSIQVEVDPREDIALLQYTGGTTGLSKGVILTHYNLVTNAVQASYWMYRSEKGKERFLGVLPLFHVFGMTIVMNLSIYRAASMILVPRFKVEDVLELIQKERPTFFPGAPTMYIALINHPEIDEYDLSSLEACISGSAPLPLEVQEKFEKITGARIVEGYGLTEASPVTHCNPIWDKRKNGSIGLPWPDTLAKVVDPATGEEIEQGQIGELVVKSPTVMKGYWNRPEETNEVLQDGWLLTGDMATVDDEGYFYIVDRKKDMIIAGGYNIYPRDVEEVLFEHPAVQEAVVVGIPDPYRGETVKAFIVLKEGIEVTEKELDDFCRTHLAAYKVPRLYEFRTELPKTLVGKVLRRALLEEEKEKGKVG